MTRMPFLLALSLLAAVPAAAQQPASPAPPADDPFVWLEDVESARSMEWVNAKNAVTVATLTASPLYQTLYDRIKQILEADQIAATRAADGNVAIEGGVADLIE